MFQGLQQALRPGPAQSRAKHSHPPDCEKHNTCVFKVGIQVLRACTPRTCLQCQICSSETKKPSTHSDHSNTSRAETLSADEAQHITMRCSDGAPRGASLIVCTCPHKCTTCLSTSDMDGCHQTLPPTTHTHKIGRPASRDLQWSTVGTRALGTLSISKYCTLIKFLPGALSLTKKKSTDQI